MAQGLLLWFIDLVHSLIEGEAENLDKQVDGVACQSAAVANANNCL
jgi:hypothetical protein